MITNKENLILQKHMITLRNDIKFIKNDFLACKDPIETEKLKKQLQDAQKLYKAYYKMLNGVNNIRVSSKKQNAFIDEFCKDHYKKKC